MPSIDVPDENGHWITLRGRTATVAVDYDLTLRIYQGSPPVLAWQSMASAKPTAWVVPSGRDESLQVPLGSATDRALHEYQDEAGHRGQQARLRGFTTANVDVELEIIFAINDDGELLLQVEQVHGKDTVQRISGLYHWRLTPAPDAYMMVPRGSGYLIRANQSGEAEVNGFFGSAQSMPLFGMVCGNKTQYQIVETWWDTHLSVKHTPGKDTVLALDWEASCGKLSYPRRVLIRFGEDIDHVGMAKGYRQYLIQRGELRTLKEKVETLPVLAKYLQGVEYRWTEWREEPAEAICTHIRHFQEAGLPISFFYPKWPGPGMEDRKSFSGGWQAYVHPNPMPGGWPAAVQLLEAVHELDCTVKVMLTPHVYHADAPDYDPAKTSDIDAMPSLSDHYAEWMIKSVFDSIEQRHFNIDAMYFDGSAAYSGHNEHQGRTRRQGFEAQLAQFRETRRRGVIPGAELARAWAIPECDYFFFTDWSSDRLRNGEPVPVMPLIFHDCYGAHFSGGGYYNEGVFDWYEDRHPRLYELMYAAVPSHNWLPDGSRPIAPEDWGSDKMNRRLKWLKRWHTYYQQVCYSEMTDHQYLNATRTLQRIKFANGITADFDLGKGLIRVHGVEGFTGDWEKPETVER